MPIFTTSITHDGTIPHDGSRGWLQKWILVEVGWMEVELIIKEVVEV